MSKTQLNGGRIRKKSLTFDHFVDGVKIPEANLLLQYPLHNHANKGVIDRIRYSGTAENVDLRNIELMMTEIISARRNGNNLGGTIDEKADRGEITAVQDEVSYARGGYETLYDAIRAAGIDVDNKIIAHIGSIGHVDLDAMYADWIAARGGLQTLAARLADLEAGTGTGSGGDPVFNLLKPWTYRTTLVADVNGQVPREVVIPYDFSPNANTIQVFDGPLMMVPGSTGDYMETAGKITFNYDLPTESMITVTGVSAGTLYVWKETFRTLDGQQLFTTLDAFQKGQNELQVYESGLLMSKDVDYTEVDEHTIRFTDPLPAGLDVVICRRR